MAVNTETYAFDLKSITENSPRQAALTLSVVIPALNEEDGIADIVRRIKAVEPALNTVGVHGLEIIVVDDGSTDHTAEIAGSFPYVRVVMHATNRGYGAAIKTGFRHARGELVAFTDADGTYPPENFPDLCRTAIEQKADIVVGSRRSGADSQMPVVRRIGNFIWSNLVSLIGAQRVADPASGMRVLWRASVERLLPLPDGLNFTPVMSTRSLHEGLKVVELPIAYRERVGRSKLSIVRDGTRFLTTILWTSLEYNPARVMGIVGTIALAVAALIALTLGIMRLNGIDRLNSWGVFLVFTALVLSVAGVSIFTLGSTFNYLVALFRRQPVRRGLFRLPILKSPVERYFGGLGLLAGVGAVIVALGTQALGILGGGDLARLWFWLLGSALLSLVGLQLMISWILVRVLEALSERENRIQEEEIGEERETSAQSNRNLSETVHVA